MEFLFILIYCLRPLKEKELLSQVFLDLNYDCSKEFLNILTEQCKFWIAKM